ncbi:MAG: heme-binding protein [Gammaproteobacteria bacterium]|nr:heme-binding protein [Gammaproteobacteria bacterium]
MSSAAACSKATCNRLLQPKPIRALLSIWLFASISLSARAIEEPSYTVLRQDDNIELRQYAPILVAETEVAGSMDRASSEGFQRLADFIFGNNTAPSGTSAKIAMTAPVQMQPSSEKISMTSPVTLHQNADRWVIGFTMPSEYTLQTIPKPNNPAVILREIPVKRMAVIRFSGFAGEEKVSRKTVQLVAWMQQNGLTPLAAPMVARYNPPWTPPFLRRNEVLIAY